MFGVTLTRKPGEEVYVDIAGGITIHVIKCSSAHVRLNIDARRWVNIARKEIYASKDPLPCSQGECPILGACRKHQEGIADADGSPSRPSEYWG